MPYYDSEAIERARQVDLLTYLQTCEPQELVHVSGNVYCTKTHDSLRISNGKWCWFSRGIGGYSALDYLIKVNGYSFMDAMETIIGRAAIRPPSFVPAPKEEKPKHLLLPQAAPDNWAMVDYLKKRGIDPEVIDYCIQTGRLYESRNKGHSNVVFVGFDKDGKARFGCLRGIGEGRFHPLQAGWHRLEAAQSVVPRGNLPAEKSAGGKQAARCSHPVSGGSSVRENHLSASGQ